MRVVKKTVAILVFFISCMITYTFVALLLGGIISIAFWDASVLSGALLLFSDPSSVLVGFVRLVAVFIALGAAAVPFSELWNENS